MIIFDRIISCSAPSTTSADVSRLCQESVPLAMSSLGGGLISSWIHDVGLNSHIALELSGSVNYDTGDVFYRNYLEYFGKDEDSYIAKMETATDSLGKMKDYAEDALKTLNSHLISVLKEWSDAKATYVDIDEIVEEEKKAVRDAADVEINAIITELSNTFAKLESAKESIKHEKKTVEVKETELVLLRPIPAQLETSEQKVKDLLNKIKGITTEVEKEIEKQGELQNQVNHLGKRVNDTNALLNESRAKETRARNEIAVLEHKVEEKSAVVTKLSTTLHKVQVENHQRLHDLKHVSIQSEPFVEHVAIQTEFVCPPVSILLLLLY